MSLNNTKPSLRMLEVFEAAARLGGFTQAGQELGITQSAVSRQISDLEGLLGVPLFHRRGAHISITSTGTVLAGKLFFALNDIRGAVSDAARSPGVVTLSMLPSVATKWLAPRLGRFVGSHPEIDLRITASRHLVDFMAEGVDAAIRYGRGGWSGLVAYKLASETVTPVCTPDYARKIGLNNLSDLAGATLIYGDIKEDWAHWFQAAGCGFDVPGGPQLGDDGAILQAVLDHHGVALGRSLLVHDDLEAGKLIAPFDTYLPAEYGYWFVYPEHSPPNDALGKVEAWVKAEFTE